MHWTAFREAAEDKADADNPSVEKMVRHCFELGSRTKIPRHKPAPKVLPNDAKEPSELTLLFSNGKGRENATDMAEQLV